MNNFDIGISVLDFINELEKFNEVNKMLIEKYLTQQEIEELYNSKTKRKRIRQLISLSTERMIK